MADLGDLLGGGVNLDFLSGDNGNLGVDLNSDDANTLALLGAMGGVEKAGLQRTATPMGSIAQSLIPLFAAPIRARQMEAQSALQGLLLKAKLIGAMADLQKAQGKDEPSALDQAKTDEIRGRIANQQALLKRLGLGGGDTTDATSGGVTGATPQSGGLGIGSATKSRIVLGPNGLTLTQYDDTKSPARMAQDQQIADLAMERGLQKTRQQMNANEQAALNKPLGDKASKWVNPDTAEQALPKMTVGETQDKGYVPLDPGQVNALPGLIASRQALDQIKDLVQNGVAGDGKPLFPSSTGSMVGDWTTTLGNKARLAARAKDPVVSKLRTAATVGVIPIQRTIAHIGRPPAPEVQALIDALSSGAETKESMLSKLEPVDNLIDSSIGSMHLTPDAIRRRARALSGGKDVVSSPISLKTQSGKSYRVEEVP